MTRATSAAALALLSAHAIESKASEMTVSSTDAPQRKAASVVGFVYLFAMAMSIFAESYVGGRLIVPNNSAETTRNIVMDPTIPEGPMSASPASECFTPYGRDRYTCGYTGGKFGLDSRRHPRIRARISTRRDGGVVDGVVLKTDTADLQNSRFFA